MKLGFLFGRHQPGSGRREQDEPHLGSPRRKSAATASADGVIAMPPPEEEPPLPAVNVHAQVRNMSPRQMADWAHEMYLAGVMTWAEFHAALPAELHPDYDRTVGALTGERAQPDKARDMVKDWEEKLAFVRRHNDWDHGHVRRAERIVTLLRRQENQLARIG
ncbi:MAG TPA: hypothetical protein VK558_18830 [Patescibacteria group bacterium]|nr:hypothetical protein [Patescibacteria group bacterium]